MTGSLNKSRYLRLEHSERFIDFLSLNLDDAIFAHQYQDRKTGENWSCESIEDAWLKYAWGFKYSSAYGERSGSTFAENNLELHWLSDRLDLALSGNNSDDVYLTCMDIMNWGKVASHNNRWLEQNKDDLPSLLENNKALLESDFSLTEIDRNFCRFNAGMTKIYSLLCDDFIIYDSRVAAALCWMVVKYCRVQGLLQVPAPLRFAWMPAKEGKNSKLPKNRNPNRLLDDSFSGRFPRNVRGRVHAQHNIRANWLLSQVIEKSSSRREYTTDGLRKLEAAMFMVGYDLPEI